tara:strand:+ start:1810 stop:2484 length:675 start_codon:yes stop_codon:yes gene_type:complete
MLSLKQGLSLSSINPLWSPYDETSLEAWYKFQTGITLNGTDVSAWADSSSNSHDMVQATATEQPAYSAATGIITFASADSNNLQTTSQISLSGAFTIAMRINMLAAGGVPIADNTTVGEFIKYTTSSQMRIKIDNSQVDITLDSGTFGDDYLIITRNGSNLITLHKNGVAQADTETLSGTADIDALGVRRTDTNPFNGTMKEVEIYSSSSTELTYNINERLSSL